MKCLRCGREMRNGEDECECGHFYDDNLHGKKKIIKKKSRSITLIEILAIIIIMSILILILASFIVSRNRYSRVCETKCEGFSYKVDNNKCICSNGEEYPNE